MVCAGHLSQNPFGKIEALQKALQVDPDCCYLAFRKSIETYEEAKKFFRPSLNDLHDPFLMKDMDEAVARLKKRFQKKKIFWFMVIMM